MQEMLTVSDGEMPLKKSVIQMVFWGWVCTCERN